MRTNRTGKITRRYRDFNGGEQTFTSPLLTRDNELNSAQDVNLRFPGKIVKELGYADLEGVGSGSGSDPVRGLGSFDRSSGTNILLRAYDTNIDKFEGGSWVSVTTGLTSSNDPIEFCNSFKDDEERIYLTTGFNDNLKHWDGTNFETISDFIDETGGSGTGLQAKHIAQYQGRIYLLNLELGGTEYAGRLLASSEDVSQDTFSVQQDAIDELGEPGMGLKVYNELLYVFGITKVATWDGFQFRGVPDGRGTTNGRSVKEVRGRLIWYTFGAVLMTTGAGIPEVISRPVDKWIQGINDPYAVEAGVDEFGRYLLYVGTVSIGGEQFENTVLRYDPSLNSWQVLPNRPFKTFVTYFDEALRLYAGDVSSEVVWTVNQENSLNGDPIVSTIETGLLDGGAPEEEKHFYQAIITHKQQPEQETPEYLTVKWRKDGDSAWSQFGGTNNNIPLAGDDLITTVELPFPERVTGKNIQLQITHSSDVGSFEIYEIAIEYDQLRTR